MPSDSQRVQQLFLKIVELPPAERGLALESECGDDAELRQRIEALLKAHDDPGSFLDQPAGKLEVTVDSNPPAAESGGARKSAPDPNAAPDLRHDPTITANYERPTESGTVIADRYTLQEQIGEGGMGEVWVAKQTEPVKRKVALKLIKAGMDSQAVLARFEQERQALAIMDHPNIARVLDGGMTAAGHPFFVMELVNGLPLTKFCDQTRLTLRERLELFVSICQAVQHAHQKGIVHRDLKPGNILVTLVDAKPVPKVIDFGVAKATGGKLTDQTMSTQFGAVVGTLEYMSPEQAGFSAQDVDTRADIYSLGVILYELLTGLRPFDSKRLKQAAVTEMIRIIQEEEPSKPSTRLSTDDALPSLAATRQTDPKRLMSLLRGELDWVVMKCLEKSRDRRYESASGLARDIDKYLANEPVEARPPSASYRLSKFFKRNRGPVVAASLVLLALVAGVIGTSIGMIRAHEARKDAVAAANAEREAKEAAESAQKAEAEQRRLADDNARLANEQKQKAIDAASAEKRAKETAEAREAEIRAVLNFVQNKILAAARPQGVEGGLGHDVMLREAVEAALPFVETSFTKHPLIEARLRMTVGSSFSYLGEPGTAAQQFQAARTLYARWAPDHPNAINSIHNLANCYSDLGRIDESLRLCEEVVELAKKKFGPDHPDTLRSVNSLAVSYIDAGRYADAAKLHEETIAIQKTKLGPDHRATLASIHNLAVCYSHLGRLDDSRKLNEETLAIRRAKLGPDDPDTLKSMDNLAVDYVNLRRVPDAVQLFEEALAIRKTKLGPDHPATLSNMSNLAAGYGMSGRVEDALKLQQSALTLTKAKLGSDHPDTILAMNNVSMSYIRLNRFDDALKVSEEALPVAKAKLGSDHPIVLHSLLQLGFSYRGLNRHDDAVALLGPVLPLFKEKFHDNHRYTLNAADVLVDCYLALGRTEQAVEVLATLSAGRPQDTVLLLKTAALQAWFEKDTELADTCRRALELAADTNDAGTADRTAKCVCLLVSADESQRTAALTLARRAVELGKESRYLLYFQMVLGMAEYRSGNYAAADEALTAAAESGQDHPHVFGTSAFYRAMSLFRQEKEAEARQVFNQTVAKMKPLPADDKNPLADNATADDLILWLAFQEARDLLKLDATRTSPDNNRK